MKYVCPLITVSDMERSRHFYENVLDQKVKADFGENVTYEGDFAIHLSLHFSNLIGGREIRNGGNNFELYFEHDDLDGIVKRLESEGVEFVHELMEQPWRQKAVRFYDPDRNIIEIGESMEHLCWRLSCEGMPEDEISSVTMMPAEFVVASIKQFGG